MAMIKDGKYYNIETFLSSIVHVNCFENKQHRIDGDTEFKKSYRLAFTVDFNEILNTKVSNNSKSIKDWIKTTIYQKLKNLDFFKTAVDDI